PAPCGFFFIGRPSVRAVSRLSDLPSPRCNRVSTQRPTE
ncbi:phage associated protein, partial [Neisseria gonorrhoeae PID332]